MKNQWIEFALFGVLLFVFQIATLDLKAAWGIGWYALFKLAVSFGLLFVVFAVGKRIRKR